MAPNAPEDLPESAMEFPRDKDLMAGAAEGAEITNRRAPGTVVIFVGKVIGLERIARIACMATAAAAIAIPAEGGFPAECPTLRRQDTGRNDSTGCDRRESLQDFHRNYTVADKVTFL